MDVVYRRVVPVTAVRATLARWLEQGTLSGPTARVLARAHASLASRAIARPLRARDPDLFVVTVGGSTLGGSGKTRVAEACVRELADRGANVVLIGHRYRASRGLRAARVVSPDDRLADVGDEALACARSLASSIHPRESGSARVVVGLSRQAAFDFAMALEPRPSAIVIDGPLQLSPQRASLSILALDAASPWGAGDVAPAGDLRAPREALLAHADEVALVDATPCGVLVDGRAIDLASFTSSLRRARVRSRVGLFTAIARPERLASALARANLIPDVIVRAGDHGPLTARLENAIRTSNVDIWLATAKCAVHLEGLDRARPLAILDGSLVLSASIVRALDLGVGDAPTWVA